MSIAKKYRRRSSRMMGVSAAALVIAAVLPCASFGFTTRTTTSERRDVILSKDWISASACQRKYCGIGGGGGVCGRGRAVQPLYSSHNEVADKSSASVVSGRKLATTTTAASLCLCGIVSAMLMMPVPAAEATYSAYTRREEDWQGRVASGEVQYSTARSLRSQLQEIAPMNSESSKVFCPNGPSAAVSPLMENKCNDRLAAPSVFGRTEDNLGNSIPGAVAPYQKYSRSGELPSSGNLAVDVGGFPKYK